MIYLKSTSQLCDSYRSVTLYLQLSIKEQPQIHWLEKIVFHRRTILRRSASMDGWSSSSESPSGPQFFVFLLCHTLVIRHCWDITNHHFPARQRSMQDSTSTAGFLEYLREPFPKITWLVSPLYKCIVLGPKTTPLLVMRKGLPLLIEIDQDLPPFHGYPNSASKQ